MTYDDLEFESRGAHIGDVRRASASGEPIDLADDGALYEVFNGSVWVNLKDAFYQEYAVQDQPSSTKD